MKMNRKEFMKTVGIAGTAFVLGGQAAMSSLAQENAGPQKNASSIELPTPQKEGGRPLFDMISQRQSNRLYADTPVKLQDLADLLWVAFGFNRPDMRVIPTANNKQELDVYAILKEGVYHYEPAENKLTLITAGDHRLSAGKQDYVHNTPVNFFYVNDDTKSGGGGSFLAAGCAIQNVYLACTSKGLSCVIRQNYDHEPLRQLMKLNDKQHLLAAQTIGYKGKE